MLDELKKFILRGNVLDLAVGVVIGAAFNAIAKSLVDDVMMPPLGLLLGKVDFSNLFVTLAQGSPAGPYATLAAAQAAGAVTLRYGLFINAIVAFVMTGVAVFAVVKAANKIHGPAAPATRECPKCFTPVSKRASRCPACTSEITPVAKKRPAGVT